MRNDACSLLLLETKTMILRETQNQNDADDANDAESGIWYRDVLKTASRASSASLSSRKNSEGVWGTPQKCVCGYPNAMLAKHVYLQNDDKQTRYPHKFVYAPEWISLDSSENLDSKKWISSDSLFQKRHNLNNGRNLHRKASTWFENFPQNILRYPLAKF